MNPASLWRMLSSHFRASSVHAWHAELVDWQTSAGLLPGTPGVKEGSGGMDSGSCGSGLGGGIPIRSRGSRDRPTTATTETAATAGTAQSAVLIGAREDSPMLPLEPVRGSPGQPGGAGVAVAADGATPPPADATGRRSSGSRIEHGGEQGGEGVRVGHGVGGEGLPEDSPARTVGLPTVAQPFRHSFSGSALARNRGSWTRSKGGCRRTQRVPVGGRALD
jgi:hypothetical protein